MEMNAKGQEMKGTYIIFVDFSTRDAAKYF